MTREKHTTVIAAARNLDKLAWLRTVVGSRRRMLPLPVGLTIDEPEPDPHDHAAESLRTISVAKALAVSAALGDRLTIASDGGLVVPALGERWRPALTRRFAGSGATNRERAAALLALAGGLTGDQRRIGWRESVAIAEGGRVVATFTAEATPGRLVEEVPAGWDDGGQGFWVPRLWATEPGSTARSGAGADHWDRLAPLVASFLDGLDDCGVARATGPVKGSAEGHWS